MYALVYTFHIKNVPSWSHQLAEVYAFQPQKHATPHHRQTQGVHIPAARTHQPTHRPQVHTSRPQDFAEHAHFTVRGTGRAGVLKVGRACSGQNRYPQTDEQACSRWNERAHDRPATSNGTEQACSRKDERPHGTPDELMGQEAPAHILVPACYTNCTVRPGSPDGVRARHFILEESLVLRRYWRT